MFTKRLRKTTTMILAVMLVVAFTFSINASAATKEIPITEKSGNIEGINRAGKVYGAIPTKSNEEMPDLIAVVTDDGKEGYITKEDFKADVAASPEEAIQMMNNPEIIEVAVYDSEGSKTVGKFTLNDGRATAQPLSNKTSNATTIQTYHQNKTISIEASMTLQTANVYVRGASYVISGSAFAAGEYGVKALVLNKNNAIVKSGNIFYNTGSNVTGVSTSTTYSTKSGSYRGRSIAYAWHSSLKRYIDYPSALTGVLTF